MQDLLQGNDQLRADVGLSRIGEDRNQTRANGSLFVIGDGGSGSGGTLGLYPALVDAILEVDGR